MNQVDAVVTIADGTELLHSLCMELRDKIDAMSGEPAVDTTSFTRATVVLAKAAVAFEKGKIAVQQKQATLDANLSTLTGLGTVGSYTDTVHEAFQLMRPVYR